MASHRIEVRAAVVAFATFAGFAAVACGGPPAPDEADPDSPAARAEAGGASVPDRDVYVQSPLALAERTTAGARSAFGAPDSVTTEPIANRHVRGQTDTLATLHYPGATFEFYRVTGGREFLRLAVVASDRYLRHARPAIGTPVDSLVAWFGPPAERIDGKLMYRCESCIGAEEPVLFWIEAGRVRRVELLGYVD